MKNKINNIVKIIYPSKKINFFVFCLLLLGITLGATFASVVDINDKKLIIEKIELFISNINSNSIDIASTLKNSISINFIYLFFIWFFGMTIIGVILSVILLFLKGFIIGFSLASFIVTYSYKGLILSTIYLFLGQLLNILVICTITIYSITISHKLLTIIVKNRVTATRTFLKNYLIIFLLLLILSLISSVSECILLPAVIRLIIKLFI